MTEAPDRAGGYDEMDLGRMLRVLFARKWLIAGVTLLAGLATAAYSLTKANVYESSAALIVREPQAPLEQRAPENPAPIIQQTPSLSVETLQTLTESTETVRALFDDLWAQGTIEAWAAPEANEQLAFRNFQNCLSTELMKQQNRRSPGAAELLPVLVLHARWRSPEEAQVIANEWARIAEDKSREVYTIGVEASKNFIGEMFDESNTELENLEDSLKSETLGANLRVKEARQDSYSKKIIALEDAILDIDVEIAVNTRAITEGSRRALEQEFEGDWIGAVAEDALLRGAEYPFEMSEISDVAAKVVDLTQRKVSQRDALRHYLREQNLLAKQKQFEHYEADIVRILAEKSECDDELPSLEGSLASLEKLLESIPEKVVLSKAITDDALWQSYLEGGETADKARTPLQSESLNPVYTTTIQSVVQLSSEIQKLRAQSSQLASSAEEVKQNMNELEVEIDQIQQELDRRTSALEATQGSLTLLRDDYIEERNLVDELIVDNMRKEEEKEIRQDKRDEYAKELDGLEVEVADSKLAIDQLTRRVETTENVRSSLAARAEAVDLLQLSANSASRTGTAIFYNAEANFNKVAPARTKMVLAAMVGALALASLMVCAWEVARTS